MDYETRMEICRRIRMLEYDPKGEAGLRKDIYSSTEFTKDEKDSMYLCIDKLKPKAAEKKGMTQIFSAILPYLVASGLGYGARVMQEKFEQYEQEGVQKARDEFMEKNK